MKTFVIGIAAACVGASLGAAAPALSADLPESTQKMIKALKLEGKKVIEGLNAEASNTPAAIVEAARKEPPLRISGSIDLNEFREMSKPLFARYPFLKVSYSSADQFARNVKPLIAYKEGRVIADIIEGLGVNLSEYLKAKALIKINDIPNFYNVPVDMRDPDGYFVGPRIRYWCMTYNTNKVKESELPRTWDDLLNARHLYNGRIGMGNRPNNFMIMLWGAKGPEWSKMFMRRLFTEVKPQLRKEGANALVSLTAAGELDIAFPTAAYRTAQYIKKGAPVSWHCPEPVPISSSAMVVMNGSKSPNAAKLYVNWFLSKEGQLAQHYVDGSPPVHKDMQDASFLAFPKQILGRPGAVRTPKLLEKDMPTVAKLWEEQWLGAQGLKITTVSAKITKSARGGRKITFETGGKTQTVSVSGRRTKIRVAGKRAKRRAIKAGMACEITYPGNGQEAKMIACK